MEAAMSKKLANIDYKDAYFLRKFLNSQGKMYPPKRYGLSAKEQRGLALAEQFLTNQVRNQRHKTSALDG